MGLRLKFNLVLLVVFLLGLGVTGYESYELLHKNAREEVLRNAGVMMESALSMRGYTVAQVRPLLQADPEKFLPQSVPAYAATEIMTLLRDLTAARGIPAIVNIHNVELAKRFAARIVGMSGGAVVFDGAPASLTDAHLKQIYGGHGEKGWLDGE